jgi:hypothetical protein
MRWKDWREMMQNNLFREKKLFSLTIGMMILLTSFTFIFVIVLPESVKAEDSWIGIDGTYYEDCCGWDAVFDPVSALNGMQEWVHAGLETHWLTIDLGENYYIRKIRGRSETAMDPTNVNIYINYDSEPSTLIHSGITTWQNNRNWVEIDIPDTHGRYIKFEITSTEDVEGGIAWGGAALSILDVWGEDDPQVNLYVNADGTIVDWIPHQMAPDYTQVDETTPDDDTTHVFTNVPNNREYFNYETSSDYSSGRIIKVGVTGRFKASNALDRVDFGLVVDGREHGASAVTVPTTWTNLEPGTTGWLKNPETNKAWTSTDVANLQTYMTFDHAESDGDFVYCTQIYLTIYYMEADYSHNEGDNNVDIGDSITFDGVNSLGDVNWSWDFNGDGTIDDYGETVSYSYTKAGSYVANLTIRDGYSNTHYYHPLAGAPLTVNQKITVYDNANNNGNNFITWGANASVMASTLANDLGLGNGDLVERFNPTTGNWDMYNVQFQSGDFSIGIWEHVMIDVSSASEISASFTPGTGWDEPQDVTMQFDSNNSGYNYITWTQDYEIDPEDFLDNCGIGNEDVTIYVHDPSTNNWNSYNKNLPAVFNTLSTIQTYDVICFQAPNHADVNYLPNTW